MAKLRSHCRPPSPSSFVPTRELEYLITSAPEEPARLSGRERRSVLLKSRERLDGETFSWPSDGDKAVTDHISVPRRPEAVGFIRQSVKAFPPNEILVGGKRAGLNGLTPSPPGHNKQKAVSREGVSARSGPPLVFIR